MTASPQKPTLNRSAKRGTVRSVIIIILVCIVILLAFSKIWLPALMGWDQGVITDSGISSPASR